MSARLVSAMKRGLLTRELLPVSRVPPPAQQPLAPPPARAKLTEPAARARVLSWPPSARAVELAAAIAQALLVALLLWRGHSLPGAATADFAVPEPRRQQAPCSWPDNPCDAVLVSKRLFRAPPAAAAAALLAADALAGALLATRSAPACEARALRAGCARAAACALAALLVGQTDVFGWAAAAALSWAGAALLYCAAQLAASQRASGERTWGARWAPHAGAWAAEAGIWLALLGKPALASEETLHVHSAAVAATRVMAAARFANLLLHALDEAAGAPPELSAARASAALHFAFVAALAWPVLV
jgi:hypothetical protein